MAARAEIAGYKECESCGADIPIKITKHGGLFGYCRNIVRPDLSGHEKYCRHKIQYSPYAAEKEIQKLREEQNHVEPETQDSEGNAGSTENAGDAGETESGGASEPRKQRGGGIFSSFFD